MWTPGMLLQWSLLATGILSVSAWGKDQFIEGLVRDYLAVDQAGQADTNRDGLITSQEFRQSLYQLSDSNGNNDNRVSLVEFVDTYGHYYNVSSELAVIMFDILNDPNSQDDVITARDVSLMSFLGRDYASIEEYRSGLEKWFRQAAERLYQHLTNPHVIGRNQNEGPRYEGIVNIDANRDGTIGLNELRDELARYHSSLSVSRMSWVKRNVEIYDADSVPSVLTFDLWDRDGDMSITSRDLPSTLQDMDLNADDQVTVEELLKYTERGYKLSQKLLGLPIQHSLVVCPAPWWSPHGLSPTIDSIRATMDLDADMDGWITLDDLDRWLAAFDVNDDERLDEEEFTVQQSGRYGVNGTVAAAMFDMADTNGDGGLSAEDWIHHFQDDIEISFCDVRRSVLDLVRLAEAFKDMPKGPGRRNAMKRRLQDEWLWYLQSNMMMARPFGRETNVNLCQGRVACYPGESTTAWGLAGASLWWGSDVDRKWNKETMGPGSMGQPWSGMGTVPFFPFRRSTQIQHPFRQANTPVRGVQGNQPFSSYRNGQNFRSSQSPQSVSSKIAEPKSNTPSQGNVIPLFKRYQHLFASSRESSTSGGSQRTTEESSQFGSNHKETRVSNGEKELQRSTSSFSGSETPISADMRPSKAGLRQGNSADMTGGAVSENKVDMGPMLKENLPQQFPFHARTSMPVIGLSTYPVVLGLDPWIFGGLPNWRWGGKKKREKNLSEEHEKQPFQNSEENFDMELSQNIRKARDANSDEDQRSSIFDRNDTFDSFDPWHAPPLGSNPFDFGFHLSPYDMWISWMMDSLLWETLRNQTEADLNRTDIDSLWTEISHWLQKEMEKSMNNMTQRQDEIPEVNSTSRSERATKGDNKMNNIEGYESGSRKLYIETQRFRRNPYFNAIRNWIRSYGQMFEYLNSDFENYNPSSFSASGQSMNYDEWSLAPWRNIMFRFKHPWFMENSWGNHFWSRLASDNQHAPMEHSKMKRKRQTAINMSGVDESNGDVEGHTKRTLTFSKLLQTKGDGKSQLGNEQNRKTHSPSSTNLWRGAVSQYGRENNWKEHLKSQSGQWGSSAKEKYGYSDEKWLAETDPYSRSHFWKSGHGDPNVKDNWWRVNNNNLQTKFSTPPNSYPSFRAFENGGLPKNSAAFFGGESPGYRLRNFQRNGGVNGRPTGFSDSRSWYFSLPSFRVSNDRWQDNNNPYSSLRTLPIYFNGNGLSGWSSMIAPWTKRQAKDTKRSINHIYLELAKKRTKRQSVKTEDSHGMESQLKGSDISRPPRDHWDISDLPDVGVCKQDNTAYIWLSPWRSWNYINSRDPRKAHKTHGDLTKTKKRNVFESIMKAKRRSHCERAKRNYLQSFNNELYQLRRFGEWLRQRGKDSFYAYNWKNPWPFRWKSFWNERGFPSTVRYQWFPSFYNRDWNMFRHARDATSGTTAKRITLSLNRFRRDALENRMNKRWNNWWNQQPMPYRQPWWRSQVNGMRSPFMHTSFWHLWYNDDNWGSARYPRKIEKDQVELNQYHPDTKRAKRDTTEEDRNKRWNNWWNHNTKMYRYPWWNSQWNGIRSPSMYSQFWPPWYNYGGHNFLRYPRTSPRGQGDNGQSQEQFSTDRSKRDTAEVDRSKRWNTWWNQNYMMYRYPWWNRHWNEIRSHSMYSQFWYPWYSYYRLNYMRYPRTSEEEKTELHQDQPHMNHANRDTLDEGRTKRWNNLWNQNTVMYKHPWWNSQWKGMRSPYMYSQFWYPWYNYGSMNYMRYPRISEQEDSQDKPNTHGARRDAAQVDRSRRWNKWWNQSSAKYRDPWGNRQWNGLRNPFMYSQVWYPSYDYDAMNYMRYPRTSEEEEVELNQDQPDTDRVKRNIADVDRSKRWNNWWNQHSMMYRYPKWKRQWSQIRSPYMYSQFWYPGYNYGSMRFIRYPRTSPGQLGDIGLNQDQLSTHRSKRDAAEVDRSKRWNMWWIQNDMMYRYPWWNRQWNEMRNPSIYSQFWFPRHNYGSMDYMRYPRTTEEKESELNQDQPDTNPAKRNRAEEDRSKRWNNWWNQNSMTNRYPWWHSQWNGIKNPFMYSPSWYPWYYYSGMNYMRYPRTPTESDMIQDQQDTERAKRDTAKVYRSKRWNKWWNQDSMMYGYPWWNNQWNGMRNPSMNSHFWYPWHNYDGMNYMRYPRTPQEEGTELNQDKSDANREKRDTVEEDRSKRWNSWWNQNSMMYRYPWWNSQWNRMRSPMYSDSWYPWYDNDDMNHMRYPRTPREEGTELNQGPPDTNQAKRDTEEADRNKRWDNWWNQNSLIYRYPWWNNQWNGMIFPLRYPWYNKNGINYMRYTRTPKETKLNKDQADTQRTQRDTADLDRGRRWNNWWNQNSMMYGYPWENSQWNGMRSPFMYSQFWYPGYNYDRMNYNRYTRTSEEEEAELKQDQPGTARAKRDTAEVERSKRWNNWRNQNSMMYRYPWWNSQWNRIGSSAISFPFLYSWYNNDGMNHIRYLRTSRSEETELNQAKSDVEREKRDTVEVDRSKRWNSWWNQNSMMFGYPWENSQWNGMRGPSLHFQFWYPWYTYGGMKYMRYPRTPEKQDTGLKQDQQNTNRPKREMVEEYRNKRWNSWWNQNSMMYRYPWWNSQWNRMRSPMFSDFWYPWYHYDDMNHMRYPRTPREEGTELNQDPLDTNQAKRDTAEEDRNKRWDNWWNQNSLIYKYPWWNNQWNGMIFPSRYPWYNKNGINYMRYTRTPKESKLNKDQADTQRTRRDTADLDRGRRWNNWWNQNSMMYGYPWENSQWNGMRSPFMYSQFWYPEYNYDRMNYNRYTRTLKEEEAELKQDQPGTARAKRDTVEVERSKRWNNWRNQNSMIYRYPWWNSQWNGIGTSAISFPFLYPWYNNDGMNHIRYLRTSRSEETELNQAKSNADREKRDTVEVDRNKRWNNWWNQNSMMFGYPWENSQWNAMRGPSLHFQFWYPWYNYGGMKYMRYPRTPEKQDTGLKQDQQNTNPPKRETAEEDRNKRWDNWWLKSSMMYRYPWWNIQWNAMRSPFMYSHFLYPEYNYGRMNYNRYTRTSEEEEAELKHDQPGLKRAKRDTAEVDRSKRWNNWWNQNSMMYKYPLWKSQWNRMGSPSIDSTFWYQWYNNNDMNHMRTSRSEETELNQAKSDADRKKRDTVEVDRNKRWNRWWNQNSMMYRYPWWNSQWNRMRSPMYSDFWYPWYHSDGMNRMRYPRTPREEGTELNQDPPDTNQAKRDTAEADRNKRWDNWWNQNSLIYRYPGWNNQWNGMIFPLSYPWYNNNGINYMRYTRIPKETTLNKDQADTQRTRRDTTDLDRGRRWNSWWNQNSMMYGYRWENSQWNGMRSPFMYSQFWYPGYNNGRMNYNRYTRTSEEGEAELKQDQPGTARAKRDTAEVKRSKRWNNWRNQNSMIYRYPWWNSQWNGIGSSAISSPFLYPWYNNDGMNHIRYLRTSRSEETELNQAKSDADREKRDTVEVDRSKRWNNLRYQNSMMFGYPWENSQWNAMRGPSLHFQFWYPWYNYGGMKYMRYPRTPEKQDTELIQDQQDTNRPKRETVEEDRNKRWDNWWLKSSMMYRYPWWNIQWNAMKSPFMYSHFLYPEYNYGRMNYNRYTRTSEEEEEAELKHDQPGLERAKRDTAEVDRSKRWNNWWNQNSMYKYPLWKSQWNQMESPSIDSPFWYPWYNKNDMNHMGYLRTSRSEETELNQAKSDADREKRDTVEVDRNKRWNRWWNQNSMMYRYPWWNSQWNRMRSPMYSDFWYPWYHYNGMNRMRYPRTPREEGTELNQDPPDTNQAKRDTAEADRNKRWDNWWNQNSLIYRYPGWNNQWNGIIFPLSYPWYNNNDINYMRYTRIPKETTLNKDQADTQRTRRDTTDLDRGRRWNNWWNQNSMMYGYPWENSQWNGMRSPFMYSQFWYPGYNYGRMNYNRYTRTSEEEEAELKQKPGTERAKRDTAEVERSKRGNNWRNQNSIMYRYPWWKSQWNGMESSSISFPFLYPWYNNDVINHMRYPRTSEKTEQNQAESDAGHRKRDRAEAGRNKRKSNWWNENLIYRYPWQNSQWNGMRSPFMYSHFWYPWYNYVDMNYMRYPRTLEKEETRLNEGEQNTDHAKRDKPEEDRSKRRNNLWSESSMTYKYPWRNNQWIEMQTPFMYSHFWYPWHNYVGLNSNRYTRTPEKDAAELKQNQLDTGRAKRDTAEVDRDKRWNSGWNQNSMMYRYPWWDNQWEEIRSASMYSQFWYPWYNNDGMNHMRYVRKSRSEETELNQAKSDAEREKRDTLEVDRSKRWNSWWNQNSMMHRYPLWNSQWNGMISPTMYFNFWYPWYNYGRINYMRYPRAPKEGKTELNQDRPNTNQAKRDTAEVDRNKRRNNWWNQNSVIYGYPWWNNKWNGIISPLWYPWYNNNGINYIRYQRTPEETELNKDQIDTERTHRDRAYLDRSRRWNNWWNQNSMMYGYPLGNSQWNGMRGPSLHFQFWYPWYNYSAMKYMRYPRTSGKEGTGLNQDQPNTDRAKRDAMKEDRNKRWNNWWSQNSMMYKYPWWNSQWYGIRSPFMYSQFWSPWYNYEGIYSDRYQRSSEREYGPKGDRVKRDTGKEVRKKRWNNWWNQDILMNRYPWNGWWNRLIQSSTIHSQIPGDHGSDFNFMRFPRSVQEVERFPSEKSQTDGHMGVWKSVEKADGPAKVKRKHENTKPILNSLKSFLSGRHETSKMYKNAFNVRSQHSGLSNDLGHKKRMWEARKMTNQLMDGFQNRWNKNRGTSDGRSSGNNWFMRWMIKNSFDGWQNDANICVGEQNAWTSFCSLPFWHNAFFNTLNNELYNWVQSGFDSSHNHNIAFSWWFPPLNTGFFWYPPVSFWSNFRFPRPNNFEGDFNGGRMNNYLWDTMSNGWNALRWRRELESSKPKDKNDV